MFCNFSVSVFRFSATTKNTLKGPVEPFGVLFRNMNDHQRSQCAEKLQGANTFVPQNSCRLKSNPPLKETGWGDSPETLATRTRIPTLLYQKVWGFQLELCVQGNLTNKINTRVLIDKGIYCMTCSTLKFTCQPE